MLRWHFVRSGRVARSLVICEKERDVATDAAELEMREKGRKLCHVGVVCVEGLDATCSERSEYDLCIRALRRLRQEEGKRLVLLNRTAIRPYKLYKATDAASSEQEGDDAGYLRCPEESAMLECAKAIGVDVDAAFVYEDDSHSTRHLVGKALDGVFGPRRCRWNRSSTIVRDSFYFVTTSRFLDDDGHDEQERREKKQRRIATYIHAAKARGVRCISDTEFINGQEKMPALSSISFSEDAFSANQQHNGVINYGADEDAHQTHHTIIMDHCQAEKRSSALELVELVLMVGAPGSGKTCFARRAFSSDPRYVVLHGDDRRHSREEDMRLAVTKAISQGKCVVIDSPNHEPRRRSRFVRAAHEQARSRGATLRCRCVCLTTPLQLCLERNRKRKSNRVPLAGYDSYAKRYAAPTRENLLESCGSDAIHIEIVVQEVSAI